MLLEEVWALDLYMKAAVNDAPPTLLKGMALENLCAGRGVGLSRAQIAAAAALQAGASQGVFVPAAAAAASASLRCDVLSLASLGRNVNLSDGFRATWPVHAKC